MNAKNTTITITILVVILSYAVFVIAENNVPLGAETVTVIQTETSNISLYPAANITAEAGNVTEISITGVSQTKSWQGYYGNVSGTIILEDAQGNRFYDWTAAEPQGEIYASVNQTVSWTTVECANFSDGTYMTSWNTFYGMNNTDADTINITYNSTNHPELYTGTTTLNGCPTTYTYVNSAWTGVEFPSVVLTTDSQSTMIFAAMIENDDEGARNGTLGFDNADHDFQLLVAEDGSNGNDVVTTYYFWVELE